jgi:hypothetical protein
MRGVFLLAAAVAVAASGCTTTPARPFADPRFEAPGTRDTTPAFESAARDPGCEKAELVCFDTRYNVGHGNR